MKRPDEALLKAMKALHNNGAFRVVREWFEESLQMSREAGDNLEGTELYRNQGKSKTLAHILDVVDNVQDSLDRFAKSKEVSGAGGPQLV